MSKRFSFDAAHSLPDHDGPCRRLHGHTYGVEIVVAGPIIDEVGHPKNGMVVDFHDLDAAWEKIDEKVDHQNLNDVFATPTTAENIARWIFSEVAREIPGVVEVAVQETPKTEARVYSHYAVVDDPLPVVR